MSVRSIIGGELTLGNLNVTTINDFAYPPVSSAGTLAAVLLTGNNAGASSIDMNNQNITGVNNIALTTVNGSAYPPASTVPTLSQVVATGNDANNQSITGLNNINLTTINGAAYPPVTGAGTVVTSTNTVKNITTGTPQLVSQVSLVAGTWTIDILLPLSFPTGSTLLFEQLWLQNSASPIPSGLVYWTVSDNRDTVLISGGQNNWTRGWSVTYYFATTRTIYLTYQANFSGASSTPTIPATPAGQYTIRATRIA
jgi:hypothetical protein